MQGLFQNKAGQFTTVQKEFSYNDNCLATSLIIPYIKEKAKANSLKPVTISTINDVLASMKLEPNEKEM